MVPLDAVLGKGRWLLTMLALWGLLDAVNLVIGGALKGAGDTRFVLVYSVLTSWLVWMPGELLLLLWLDSGLLAAWLWLALYVLLLATGFWLRFRRGKWKAIDMIAGRAPAPPPAAEAAP